MGAPHASRQLFPPQKTEIAKEYCSVPKPLQRRPIDVVVNGDEPHVKFLPFWAAVHLAGRSEINGKFLSVSV
jgi:hypothetical protein